MKKRLLAITTVLCTIVGSVFFYSPIETKATNLDLNDARVTVGENVTINLLDNDEGPATWTVDDGSVLEIVMQDTNFAVVRGLKAGESTLVAHTSWWTYYCEISVVQPKNRVVYKEDGITVTATGFTYDEYGDALLMFNTKNNTNKKMYVFIDELTVNGYAMGDDIVCDIPPKSQANDDVEVYRKYLNKNGITNIKNASYIIRIVDAKYNTVDKSKRIKMKF